MVVRPVILLSSCMHACPMKQLMYAEYDMIRFPENKYLMGNTDVERTDGVSDVLFKKPAFGRIVLLLIGAAS